MAVDSRLDSPNYAVSGVDKKKLHQEMLERHEMCRDYWREQYSKAEDDMEFAFIPDKQWDDWMSSQRKGRAKYTVNKLRQAIKQITNDQRQNRIEPKVRAMEEADKDLAEIRQGLIRNIDSASDADRARDTAFQFAVGGGFGVYRVNTAYEDDAGFDLVIRKEEIANPYTVTFDPAAKSKDRRDARFAFVDSTWSRQSFKAKWPKAKLVSVDQTTSADRDWFADKEVTVSEYWYKRAVDDNLLRFSDGSDSYESDVVDVLDELAAEGITVVKTRPVERQKVYQCVVSGAEILEGPNEWPGKFIPLVVVWGDILNIKGKEQFCGAVRFGKDPQRMFNYERSATMDMIADQGYSPYLATETMVEGHEAEWQSMRTRRAPVLLYTPDQKVPGGAPTRLNTPEFPVALANASQMSADDIKSATGIYDASLGQRSNETSGKAILARQREGDVANFDYTDNLRYAVKYDFEITNDLISKIYDTERQIRIIGADGAEKIIAINKQTIDEQTGRVVIHNDMSAGRYDIQADVGPSFTTQRLEAADAFQQLANDPSPMGALAKYFFIQNADLTGGDEFEKAARKILVTQGLLPPAEGEQPPQPQQPDPSVIADAQKAQADAEKSKAQSALYGAQAQGQDLENQQLALSMHLTQQGMQAGQAGAFLNPMQYYGATAPGGIPG